jgi:competence protein ComEA
LLLASSSLLFAFLLGAAAIWPDDRPAPEIALVADPSADPPEVLAALPRLGPVLVDRIVTERRHGRFASLEDLNVRVRGIGPATAAALRPFLRFDPPETHLD